MELNSSSEVEPYSGGRRLHLLLLDTVKDTEVEIVDIRYFVVRVTVHLKKRFVIYDVNK